MTTHEELLARRTRRSGPVPVNAGDVLRWSEAHRVRAPRHWPAPGRAWVAPPAMVTTFIRVLDAHPDEAAGAGGSGARGLTLHDEVKQACGLPSGIAGGYEMVLHALLHDGDRLELVERVASLGEPETTRLGPGRRWVIENEVTRVGDGELVAVERFHMLGYDPSDAGPPAPVRPDPVSQRGPVRAAPLDQVHVEELDVTAVAIVMGASANRVWTPAHVDVEAAAAAGIADLFLDTSTQVGLLSVVGGRAAHAEARPGRLSLRMRRPVLRGDHLVLEATAGPPVVDDAGVTWVEADVRATVGGELRSSLTGRWAVPTDEGTDPWALGPDRWHP